MIEEYLISDSQLLLTKKANMTITEERLFDLALLEQMDDENFIIQIIEIFLLDTPADLAIMEHAFKDGDLDTVCKTAHKLKSSTGMLQANSLFGMLGNIEKLSKTGITSSQLTELVQSSSVEFNQLKNALKLHLHDIKAPE